MSLPEKLAALRQELTDDEDLDQVKEWESATRIAMLNDNLDKHDGIQLLKKELQRKIDKCNLVLREDRTLSIDDRRTIFTKRDCWNWFLNIFDTSAKQLKRIEDQVTKELSEVTSESYGTEE